MFKDIIKEVREEKGLSQKNLGQMSFLSYKTISAIETGRRNVTYENLKNICKELNDPKIYFEAVGEITGDVFGLNWLDGEAADLHRASVKEKIIEELTESINAINLTKVYKTPQSCNQEEKENVIRSIQETIDVFNASAIYIAVMCKEFDLDIKEMFSIQKEKLIQRGYLKQKKKKNTLGKGYFK